MKDFPPALQRGEADELLKRGERDKVVEGCQRIVAKCAYKYLQSGADIEDLIQEGNLALLDAIRTFDPSRGASFYTYASRSIDVGILHYLYRESSNGSSLNEAGLLMARIKKYINEYYVQTGREPSAEEIAENTNVRLNKVMDLLVLLRGFASLNEMSVDSEDFDVELMDTLQDPTDGIQDADDCMMVEQILHDLDEILTPKDKELVLGALGFYGDDHATTVYQQACCSPQIRADYKTAIDRIRSHYHVPQNEGYALTPEDKKEKARYYVQKYHVVAGGYLGTEALSRLLHISPYMIKLQVRKLQETVA